MQLARFLNNIFKNDGFILINAESKKYIVGSPKKKIPITLKILNKKLHYKLLFRPDLYFGEAYTNGDILIEDGTLTDFLDIVLMNIGRSEINFFSKKYPKSQKSNMSNLTPKSIIVSELDIILSQSTHFDTSFNIFHNHTILRPNHVKLWKNNAKRGFRYLSSKRGYLAWVGSWNPGG